MKNEQQPALSEETQQMASYLAMVVRNAMEDFHVKHLTDEQMRELNPIIRNAIATALHAFDHYERSMAARTYVDYAFRSIPKYWEKPALIDDYKAMWERRKNA